MIVYAPLTIASFWVSLLYFAFCFVGICLILLVMLQRGDDEGLGSALGGGGSADSILGVKSVSAIKYVTGWLAMAFMVLALVLAMIGNDESVVKDDQLPVSSGTGE